MTRAEKKQLAQIIAYNDVMAKQVVTLCEQEGFGFVIDKAAREWARREPDSAFAIGPCRVFTKSCVCKRLYQCDSCHGCGWVFKK